MRTEPDLSIRKQYLHYKKLNHISAYLGIVFIVISIIIVSYYIYNILLDDLITDNEFTELIVVSVISLIPVIICLMSEIHFGKRTDYHLARYLVPFYEEGYQDVVEGVEYSSPSDDEKESLIYRKGRSDAMSEIRR